ncbi:MAG: PKD domain-containing protein [Candidatus Bipolaricaulota bacterium]|nr:PKD domain-containing protein [Candidatus Bipolaricaulota bacterium]
MDTRKGRGWALAAAAAVAVWVSFEALAGVGLTLLSADKEARPGEFVTHVFSIMNTGPASETYDVSVDVPAGWTTLGVAPSLTLGPGDEDTLFVTITIPSGVRAGVYAVEITAESTTDPAATASASANVEIGVSNKIEIVSPPEGEGTAPGQERVYEFTLVNRGNAQEVLAVSAESSRGLSIEVSPSSIELAPQERRTFVVRISVPLTTSAGRDVLTVTVTSTLYADVAAEAVLFTSVLPPTPSAVGGSLIELLAGRLRIGVDRNETDDTWDSHLSFSASGRVLGGYLSASFSVASPFGSDPLDVTSYQVLYRLDPTSFALGYVSRMLTDFIDVTCEGGYAAVDTAFVDLALVGGIDGDDARFGSYVTLGPEAANLGIAYSDARSQTAQESIWSATAFAEPLPDWTLRMEGAVGTDNGLLGHAFFVNTTMDTTAYFFTASAFCVDTYFPGLRSDSAGVEIAQRLRLKALSLGVSFAHVKDNVVGDPAVDTGIEDSLGFNLFALPISGGPELRTTLEFERDHGADPAIQDDVSLLVAYSLSQSGGVFPYAFNGQIVDRIDRVTGSHVRTLTHGQGVGLSVDAFYAFLRLQQETYVDVVTGATLSATSNVSVLLRPEGTLHEASITFRNELDDYDVDASLFLRVSRDVDVALSSTMGWDRDGLTPPSFGWGISARVSFGVLVPFLVTKGRIEGRLFIDRNENGTYDADDQTVEGAVLAADGRQASTDADGAFRFPPLAPGTYDVAVTELPADAAARDPIPVALCEGQLVNLAVPLSPIMVLRGYVYEDEDQDGTRQDAEGGLGGIRLILTGSDGVPLTASSSARGEFAFYDLVPGAYVLSVDSRSLPARFAFTTAETLQVDVTALGAPSIAIGGYIRPREVLVTYQPPTADFAYVPAAPAVGDAITFDASDSFDFDGTIVDYSWDFNGDGAADATGVSVVHTFEAAGRRSVTLTVTDDAGNVDKKTVALDVRESPEAVTPVAGSYKPPIADFEYSPAAPTPGTVVAFDGSASVDFDGQIVGYAWDFDGNGESDASGPSVLHVFPSAGSYAVSLTVTDDGGNRDTATYVLEIASPAAEAPSPPTSAQPPIADIQYMPLSPKAGETVMFSGEPSIDLDGTIVGYAWDLDGNGTTDATDPIVVFVFPAAGTFEVRLTVTDAGGNTDSLVIEIDVQ